MQALILQNSTFRNSHFRRQQFERVQFAFLYQLLNFIKVMRRMTVDMLYLYNRNFNFVFTLGPTLKKLL